MIQKMIRAARLDRTLYREVEANENETTNALIVVIIVAIATGLGAMLFTANPVGSLLGGLLRVVLGWVVSSFLIYFVGTRVYHAATTPGEVLRTLGYAQSPGVLAVLGFIPILGWLVGLAAGIWVLVASYVGIKEALDLDTNKTLVTIVLAIAAWIVISIILGMIFGIAGAGFGLLFGQ